MADFDAGSFMKDIVSGLTTLTQSVNVIGQPVEVAGKLIVPAVVAKIAFGAGGGSGKSGDEKANDGSGGGGGGGAVMTPVFLIVDEDGERLLTVPGPFDRASTVFEKAKDALDRVMPRKHTVDDLSEDPEMRNLADESGPPA